MSTETHTEELTARIAELEAEVSALKSAVSRGPELRWEGYKLVLGKLMVAYITAPRDPNQFVGRVSGSAYAEGGEALVRLSVESRARALLGIDKPAPAVPETGGEQREWWAAQWLGPETRNGSLWWDMFVTDTGPERAHRFLDENPHLYSNSQKRVVRRAVFEAVLESK